MFQRFVKLWAIAGIVSIVLRSLYEQGGEFALQEISRRKPILKNRIDTAIEEQVIALVIDNPALGQVRVNNELKKKGFSVSTGGVRSIWLRYNLQTFQLRLKALEAKVAQEGLYPDRISAYSLRKS